MQHIWIWYMVVAVIDYLMGEGMYHVSIHGSFIWYFYHYLSCKGIPKSSCSNRPTSSSNLLFGTRIGSWSFWVFTFKWEWFHNRNWTKIVTKNPASRDIVHIDIVWTLLHFNITEINPQYILPYNTIIMILRYPCISFTQILILSCPTLIKQYA